MGDDTVTVQKIDSLDSVNQHINLLTEKLKEAETQWLKYQKLYTRELDKNVRMRQKLVDLCKEYGLIDDD